MRLRRRLRELEARVEALEGATTVDYAMPPRHDIGSEPVDPHALWRGTVADYATVQMEDVPDDRATGVYL